MILLDIETALKTVTPNVHHFSARAQEAPYIVWAEDGQADAAHADNRMTDQTLTGTVDYFTKSKADPNFGAVQDALNSLGIPWRLNSIQYEEETGYIHYEWVWEAELWHG